MNNEYMRNRGEELAEKAYTSGKKYATKIGLGLAAAVLAISSVRTTGTTEIGIKTTRWNPIGGSGVVQTVYEPGSTQFVMPYFQEWNTLNVRTVSLEMTGKKAAEDIDDTDNELKFKARDGNDIFLDQVISYRIDPKKGPHIIENVAQSDEELQEKIVIPVVRSKIRDIFGALNTEQFYTAQERAQASEKAREEVQKVLAPYGIIVEKVDPKEYRFNKDYQDAVTQKKVAEVNTLKLKSEQEAQREQNKRALAEVESSYNEMIAKADGEYKQTVVGADAYLNQKERLAKATITEGKNMADGIREKRLAMTTAGGETNIKMAIADALAGKPILMIPDVGGNGTFNMFDLNKYLAMYAVKKVQEQPEVK